MKIKAWIEAMRLRTLPVSVAGVFTAVGFNLWADTFCWWQAALCLAFAVLAQVASNFANEYYDFVIFEKWKEYIMKKIACVAGWWLIPIGILIALGVVAYSTGPYPLSHHGLGEVAVVFFFGIIPVNLTYYVQSGVFDPIVALASVSVGLMGANVLIVNNYRDADDDREVGKHTLAVLLGRRAVGSLYLFNGYIAVALMLAVWMSLGWMSWAIPAIYLILHTILWHRITTHLGATLNPMLGMTACLMLAYSLAFMLIV